MNPPIPSQQPPEGRILRLVHISDLHFGTEQPDMAKLLQGTIADLKPDLVVASGDFTQTAISSEFRAAKVFLESLGFPVLTIPGNHDVPRYDLFERFTRPYKQYRRFISGDVQQVYRRNGVCVVGLNTARRIVPHWNWAHGAISRWQIEWMKKQFEAEPCTYRVCVMHHPVWAVTQARLQTIVFGGGRALQSLKDMHVNLVLSGHVHHAAVQTVPLDDKNKMVFLSASTALSHRLRGQKNGFNIVDFHADRMLIEMRGFLNGSFDRLESYEHLLN